MPAHDDSTLLPNPPPPRPAARDAAIAAAMRRFDGIEDKPAASAPRPVHWTRKPQFGMLVTASLVAVLGIPAALIALRSDDLRPRPGASALRSPAVAVRQKEIAPTPQLEAPAPATRLTEEPSVAAPAHHRDVPVTDSRDRQVIGAIASNNTVEEAPESRAMVAAPGAAPAPPPPAPALAQNDVTQPVADGIQVTGSLIRAPAMEKSRKAARAEGGYA